MTKHDFITSNTIGGVGEAVFLSLISREFDNIRNVTKIKEYQSQGIDFFVDNVSYDVKFDVKAASTGNLAIETISRKKNGRVQKAGWLHTTQADCIVYLTRDNMEWLFYFFTLDELQRLAGDFSEYKKEVYNYGYVSEVVLVPITHLSRKPRLSVPLVGEPENVELLSTVHNYLKAQQGDNNETN